MTDFQKQLQELIAEAATDYMNDPYNHQLDEKIHFKQGCEFLMPVLMKAVEQRDELMHECSDTKNKNNKELLNILKGQK